MGFRQEIRCDQLSKDQLKFILQILIDTLGYRIIMKREWMGAVPSFEIERKDRPPAIVKAREPEVSHGSDKQLAEAKEELPQEDQVRKSGRGPVLRKR